MGGLEEYPTRLRRHLRFFASHDPCDGHRTLGVADHEHPRFELSIHAVQCANLLSGLCGTDNNAPFLEPVEVEGVQRLAQLQHHVVRGVYDDVNRSHAGRRNTALNPLRGRPGFDVRPNPRSIPWAQVGDLDRYARLRERLGFVAECPSPDGGPHEFRRLEPLRVFGRQLTGDTQNGEAIASVRRYLDLENGPDVGFVDRFDLVPQIREKIRDVGSRDLGLHVILKPFKRESHARNCSKNR
ncbi:MAG: hypothetical protein KatS3mg015_2072 [Fimbriimonadales bacterium]|nr:MAG: hypothetical protein KatS3mg015_2072 [Fimbriimonadales bacterium]